MREIILLFMGVWVCSSVTLGTYFEIGDGDYEYDLQLDNDDVLLMTGGADIINAFGHSYIEIQNTGPYQINVGGIFDLNLDDSSSLLFNDGEIRGIDFRDDASAVLQGGWIDHISSYQDVGWWYGEPVDQHIEIICREYEDSNPQLITGIWNVDADNNGEFDTFSIQLHDQTGYDKAIDNITFTIIPEPATLFLVALGGLGISRFRK